MIKSLSATTNVATRNQPTTKTKDTTTTGKVPKTSTSRDPLGNITNNRKSESLVTSKKNLSKSSKKATTTKSSVLTVKETSTTMADLVPLPKIHKEGKMKNRKSDHMLIDEEELAVVVPPPNLVWEDIDVHDMDDPQAVVEYVNEIYEHMMEKEKDSVDPNYMNNQSEINEKMRAILVDWLVEVHRMFKLLPETLFLSIGIIDRYLSLTASVARDKLQLVGVTAMLIASKYEEIYAPECNDFVYISDGAYTKQQILKMEQLVLNALNFNLTHPSPLHFLRRYSKAAMSDYTLHTLCKYIIELMLIDVKMLKFPTSLVAAGSVYLARAMTGKTLLWTPTLEHYSKYGESPVRECALEMNELLKKAQKSSLKAIRKKYALPKFGQVAEILLVEL